MKPEIDDCLMESLSIGVQQLQFLQKLSVQQDVDSRHIADTLILDVIHKLELLLSAKTHSTPLFAPYTAGLSIGDHIQLARENLGLGEAELARLLGTYSDNISDWECGITEPPAGMVIPLANALKCDPIWLLGAEVNRQPPATPAHQSQCQHSAQQRSGASDHASHHERSPSQA